MFWELADNVYSFFFFLNNKLPGLSVLLVGGGRTESKVTQRYKRCDVLNVAHGNQASYIWKESLNDSAYPQQGLTDG